MSKRQDHDHYCQSINLKPPRKCNCDKGLKRRILQKAKEKIKRAKVTLIEGPLPEKKEPFTPFRWRQGTWR